MNEQAHHAQALCGEVIKDAQVKAERIGKKAQREAAAILKRGEADAVKAAEAALEQARVGAEQLQKQILASIPIAVRRIELDAREAVLRDAIDEARQRIEALDGDERLAVLCALIERAARDIGGRELTVSASPADAQRFAGPTLDAIAEGLRERIGPDTTLTLRVDESMTGGGVIVVGAGGRRIVDNTFAARAQRLDDDARETAWRTLFAGGEDEQKS